jgi:hypothetical protein
MAAIKIQNLAAVARIQPDAFAVRHFDWILREHLSEVALQCLAR